MKWREPIKRITKCRIRNWIGKSELMKLHWQGSENLSSSSSGMRVVFNVYSYIVYFYVYTQWLLMNIISFNFLQFKLFRFYYQSHVTKKMFFFFLISLVSYTFVVLIQPEPFITKKKKRESKKCTQNTIICQRKWIFQHVPEHQIKCNNKFQCISPNNKMLIMSRGLQFYCSVSFWVWLYGFRI